MNNKKEIEWIITEMAPGMVKIEASPFGRIPTFEEIKQKARELLSNSAKTSNNLLRDETRSQDLGDSLLLSQELKKLNETQQKPIHQIVFTYKDSTLTANIKTIDDLAEKKETRRNKVNEFGVNPDITEQVLEDYKR